MTIDDLKQRINDIYEGAKLSNNDITVIDVNKLKNDLSDVKRDSSVATLSSDEKNEIDDRINLMTQILDKLSDCKRKSDAVIRDDKLIEAMENNLKNASTQALKDSYQLAIDSLNNQRDNHKMDLVVPMLEHAQLLDQYESKYPEIKIPVPTPLPTPPTPTPTPTPPTPTPPPPTPTPKPRPVPPRPKPKTNTPTSIESYIKNGIIPALSEKELINVCKRIGIRDDNGKFPTDLSFSLSDKQLERILHSKEVREEKLKQAVVNEHNEVMNEYKDLMNEVKSTHSKTSKSDKKTRKELRDNSHRIYNDLVREKAILDRVDRSAVGTYFDFEDGLTTEMEAKRAEKITARQKEIDKKLSERYKESDKLSMKIKAGLKNGTMSKFTAVRLEQKLARIESKITSLQAKQGNLSTKQTRIVNKATKRYIDKVTREQKRYKLQNDRIDRYVDRVNDISRERNELKNESRKITSNLGMSDLNVFDRAAMRLNRASIEARVRRLNGKEASLNREEQFARTIGEAFML